MRTKMKSASNFACSRSRSALLERRRRFGEGAASAEVMLVGEQPGDKEDLTGRPFVGPPGRVLDAPLEKVGIDRSNV